MGFVGVFPKSVAAVAAGVAVAGLIAAWRFNVEARSAGVQFAEAEVERERAELGRRAPVIPAEQINPTQIGVDAAAQDILPGDEVPKYVARDVDEDLRAAVAAAFDSSGRWLVVVMGPSKVGKSRALFEAVTHCAHGRKLEFVAPVDGDAVRTTVTSADGPAQSTLTVLWLDDLEPFLNDGVTLATLREWQAGVGGRIVAATYGGKGSERIAGSTVGGLTTIAAEVLQSAREIPMTATTIRELGALRADVSAEQLVSLERHGLAAYLVAAPALERKLATRRHAPGDPECPDGAAVVAAAVDWARCGRTDTISDHTLRQLWPSYLPQGAAATDDAFDVALAWAIRPVAGTIALLHGADSYRAFDYVVRLERDKPGAGPPPDAAWAVAIDGATDAQALAVAATAYYDDRLNDTMHALASARQSSVDEVASIAGYNLGVVLRELDRFQDAVEVCDEVLVRYGDATEPALRERVAMALVNKGVRLGALDRFEDELAVCDEVLVRYGDATEPALRERVAMALVNKGVALGALDRFEDELAVYDEVLTRYRDATEPILRQAVAMALTAREQRSPG